MMLQVKSQSGINCHCRPCIKWLILSIVWQVQLHDRWEIKMKQPRNRFQLYCILFRFSLLVQTLGKVQNSAQAL